jgi:hypothetical protein
MIVRHRSWVWLAFSTLALGGVACSGGGTAKTGTAGSSGSQAGTNGGTAGSTGSPGTAGGSSPGAGGNSAAGTFGGGGATTQGTAGGGSPAGSSGSSGTSGSVAGTGGGAGDTSSTQDGGSAVMDAPVSADGQGGVVAPGIGEDSPSPPTPMIGPYGTKTQRDLQFTAASLDPMAKLGHATENQNLRFDSSTTPKWKLIVLLPGIGGGPGGLGTSGWIASQGYHEFDVAYDSAIPGAPNPPDPRASDPTCVGNTRMNQFDAKGRTPACGDDNCTANAPTIQRSDSIEERVMLGLKHAAEIDPMGGWDWYLNPDGTVRWSDAGFYGYSYGATHSAVISVYVRLGLVVVGSGPWNESHPEATWIRTASATPGARAYAIYGKMDGRYPDYENETRELGWPGPYPFEIPTLTKGALAGPTPWYMGSHSLLVDDQGHTEFCAGSNSVCLYSFDHMGQ